MFDTLDIMLSFIIVIFILSLVVQSLQAILKRVLNLKTKLAVNEIIKMVTGAVGREHIYTQTVKKEISAFKKKSKMTHFTVDNMKAVAQEIGRLDAVKNELTSKLFNIDAVFRSVTDKLGEEAGTFNEKYVNYMRQLSILIAFIVSATLNADSLIMIEKISADKAVRQMIAQSDFIQRNFTSDEKAFKTNAEGTSKDTEAIKRELANIADLSREYQGINLGIKWRSTVEDFRRTAGRLSTLVFVIKKVIGILITTVLVSMGAPFWHDILEMLFGLKNRVKEKQA